MISFEGTIKEVRFRSKDNEDYCIFILNNESQEVTVKGFFPCVYKGFHLSGLGEPHTTEEYGDTIIAKTVDIELPDEADPIIDYALSLMGRNSRSIYDNEPFVEPSDEEYGEYQDAEYNLPDFYKHFGGSFLDQIINNFEYVDKYAKKIELFNGCFFTLQGLRNNLLLEDEIREVAKELRDVDPVYARYAKGLFSVFYCTPELEKQYETVLNCFMENPYAFCFRKNLPSYSFEMAEGIANKYNLPKDSYDRCCAGIRHAFISRILSEGHVFTSEERIIQESMDILKVSRDILCNHIDAMYQNQILIKETDLRVYLKEFYDMEVYIAQKIVAINRQKTEPNLISPDFEKIQSKIGISFSEEQKKAIKGAVNSNVALITGGPGTGKTTIIRGIIEAFEEAGECSINLAAPTGKAAVRMTESTQRNAQTIHRMLGIKPNSSRNEVSTITDSVIIIDEASMIDIDLMDKLMYSISFPSHLVLVGDANQLPSVDPGYIFHDIIEANCFQTFKLSHIFRQEAHSNIKLLAKNIIDGIMIPAPVEESDYRFIATESVMDIRKKLLETIEYFLGNGYERKDIQVLSPVREKMCGSKDLNVLLQQYFNRMKGHAYKNKTDTIYSGDRVMQTQNDYTYNVFNGEITDNTVVCLNENQGYSFLKAAYSPENKEVNYIPRKYNADWVKLAYAITVHKSQGSEYPIVIMPVFSNRNMYRNLLYTATTRAKEHLVLIGFEKELEKGIISTTPTERNTYLTVRIQNENSRMKT